MRSQEFAGGAEDARTPQFSTSQQNTPRQYTPTSTLAQLMPAQNGLGEADQQRRLVGYRGNATGTSPTTYEKNLWLNHREPTQRVAQTQGG